MIQELEKDKWLCTLSQKKFKAPEFVRKHILNKFGENVEEVKMDVEFFNNYIRDDKRPSMPMAPPSLTNRGQEEPRQMKRPIEMTTGRREFQVYIFSMYGVIRTFFYESFRTSRQQREASRRGWGTEEYASPTLPKILEPSWTTATLIALLLSTLTSRQFERLQIGCGRLEPRHNLLAKNTMCLFMKM